MNEELKKAQVLKKETRKTCGNSREKERFETKRQKAKETGKIKEVETNTQNSCLKKLYIALCVL